VVPFLHREWRLTDWVVGLVLGGLLVAIALAMVRLLRGPSLPDRVVALDMIGIMAVAFLGVLSIRTGEPAFLDAALTLALIAFLATVAFARYVERSAAQRRRDGR